ncbi:MAG: hypothetical protein R8G66_26955 [Cytophagales bacterium]|nr:hypothetical protein [Cytophagales bacterium]
MMKYLLIGISLTLLVACSFSQEEMIDQEIEDISLLSKFEIGEATLEQKLAYKRHHLTKLAKWLGSKKEIISSMEKVSVFETPKPYLIEDLLDQKRANARVSEDAEQYDELLSSLDAFKGVEGEVWNPTVFMIEPEPDERGTKGGQLYVAVEDADENGEKFTGYELINNGLEVQMVPLTTEMTPDLVSNASLMVIELDYCGNTTGEQNALDEFVDCDQSGGGNTGGGNTGGGSIVSQNLVLNKIKIKDLKEAWPGRSEISLKIYKVPAAALESPVDGSGIDEFCGDHIYASDNCNRYRGRRYMRLKRRDRNKEFEVDWLLKDENNNSLDMLFYVIFEADGWPTALKTKEFTIPALPNLSPKIRFRSHQEEYDFNIISQSTAGASANGIPYGNTLTINNSAIEYNFALK